MEVCDNSLEQYDVTLSTQPKIKNNIIQFKTENVIKDIE